MYFVWEDRGLEHFRTFKVFASFSVQRGGDGGGGDGRRGSMISYGEPKFKINLKCIVLKFENRACQYFAHWEGAGGVVGTIFYFYFFLLPKI